MKRTNMIIAVAVCILVVVFAVAISHAEGVTNYKVDRNRYFVIEEEDTLSAMSVRALLAQCYREFGYVPNYAKNNNGTISFYLFKHELIVPIINPETDLLPQVYFHDDMKEDNLIRVYPARESKNAYTIQFLEGDFYTITFEVEGDHVILHATSKIYEGKTLDVKSEYLEVSEEFNQVYFTAEQARQLEYALYGNFN